MGQIPVDHERQLFMVMERETLRGDKIRQITKTISRFREGETEAFYGVVDHLIDLAKYVLGGKMVDLRVGFHFQSNTRIGIIQDFWNEHVAGEIVEFTPVAEERFVMVASVLDYLVSEFTRSFHADFLTYSIHKRTDFLEAIS